MFYVPQQTYQHCHVFRNYEVCLFMESRLSYSYFIATKYLQWHTICPGSLSFYRTLKARNMPEPLTHQRCISAIAMSCSCLADLQIHMQVRSLCWRSDMPLHTSTPIVAHLEPAWASPTLAPLGPKVRLKTCLCCPAPKDSMFNDMPGPRLN